METSCSPDEPGYVSLIVLVELAWVLGGAYKLRQVRRGVGYPATSANGFASNGERSYRMVRAEIL